MKFRAFQGNGPEIDRQYREAGHWLRATVFNNTASKEWCSQHGVKIVKVIGEGIGTSGEFLVPQHLANAIADIREHYGAFRRMARVEPMTSGEMPVPRRPGGTGAYFVGDNATATETSAFVDTVGLNAKKVVSLIRMSAELEEDSFTNAVDFVANEMAYAFGAKEDECGFNGDGTSTYGGMRGILPTALDGAHNAAKITAATNHNTFLTLDATDLGNLIGAVKAAAMPNAAWFVSQTCFAQTFCRLAGAAGGAYMYTGMVNGIVTPFYLGFPVIFCQKLPLISTTLSGKGMLAFGDMYHGAILGQRRGITIARSTERYFDQDQIGVLGTQRFDAVIHDMGDNSSAGMLAVLVGA